MDPAEAARREHDALIAAFSAVADEAGPGWVERYGGVVAAVSGSPLAFFNQLLVATDATVGDIEAALSAVEASGLGCVVTLRNGVDDHLEAPLSSAGMRASSHPTPGMALNSLGSVPNAPGLEIRSGVSALADHNQVATVGFQLSDDILAALLTPDLANKGDFTFYTGYVDGEPVTSSAGFVHDGSLTVFNVATLPDHRGNGYGAAMTLAAVEGGREQGAEVAFLQSSQMGFGVYEKLGFETVVEYREWGSRAD